jgi:tripartite-type tricarboxylate transporter receptor subunit TctC
VLDRRQFATGLAALAGIGAAHAQGPDRPIRILVGYPAGGGVDLVARMLGEPIKAAFSQPVLVENRAGASAMIAANAVAKAAPDGTVLLMAASGEVAINQHLHKDKMTYDPLRELAAVALVGIVPCVVVVAATTPVRNAAELIAYARANRGKLSFSSSGIGNPQQLAGELMNHMAGTDVLHGYLFMLCGIRSMICGKASRMATLIMSTNTNQPQPRKISPMLTPLATPFST